MTHRWREAEFIPVALNQLRDQLAVFLGNWEQHIAYCPRSLTAEAFENNLPGRSLY
jgi:hypothetical protein